MSATVARFPAYPYLQLGFYQLGWWLCVLGAAHGQPLFGPVVLAGCLLIHLACIHGVGREAILMLVATVLGVIGDSLCSCAGAVAFGGGPHPGPWPPLWMIVLWPAFAASLRLSLSFLQHRLRLAALLGALGGPLAYFAGWRLGALHGPHGLGPFLGGVACEWAIAMPLLAWQTRCLSESSPLRLMPHAA